MKSIFYPISLCLVLGLSIGLFSQCNVSPNGRTGYEVDSDSILVDPDSLWTDTLGYVDDESNGNNKTSFTKGWNETTSVDEMTDSENIWKSIYSDNEKEFDFPYNGGSRLQITVRYMKKYGSDVILTLTKGQIHCSEYSGTNYVTVRFDEYPPKKFGVNEPADGSSDYVFLKNPRGFINAAKKAKSIKVQIPVYQEGNPTFLFTVDESLTWDK